MARATRSSLKAQRSSMEPPPRPTITTSSSSSAASVARAATISPGASSPCTRTGDDQDAKIAEAPADDVEHVADGRAGGRGHDADHAGEGGQRALARLLEETLGLEPALELLEGVLERADPLGLEQLDDQLIFAARGIEIEAAEGEHFHAVLGLEAHAPAAATEEHRAELCRLVLQGEIRMSGAGRAEIADLAFHPHRREGHFELLLDPGRQLGHGKNRPLTHPLTLPSPPLISPSPLALREKPCAVRPPRAGSHAGRRRARG